MRDIDWNKIYLGGKDFSPINIILLDRILTAVQQLREKRGEESRPKNAVDLGCGTGDALVKLVEKGLEIQGIDSSTVAIEKSRELIEKRGLNNKVVLTKLDLENIPIEKIVYNPTDIVLCKLTYAFIHNKKKFLKTVYDILAGVGVFVLMTPVLHKNLTYDVYDKPNIAVDLEETVELLKNIFASVHIFHHDYFGEKGDEVTFLVTK